MNKTIKGLVGLVLVTGLTVAAAQPAQADWNGNKKHKPVASIVTVPRVGSVATVGYFTSCPQLLQQNHVVQCTYVRANDTGVRVLDRTDGTTRTWYNLTTVGMGYFSNDPDDKCGPDFAWSVFWIGAYNIIHWAAIGNLYLWIGTSADWGPLAADLNGLTTYNPDRRAASVVSGYCNGSGVANLGTGG